MLGAKGFWGLDLGESGVKAVKLRREGKLIVVEDFAAIPYAELQSEPPADRIELMHRAVSRLVSRMGRGERVVAGIPSESVLSRFIGLPPVDKRRIPEIVRFEARQQIPFDLSEVLWDYQRIRKELIPGEEIEIGLFAVRREVVDQYLVALAPVARYLVGLQINPLATYNFIRFDRKPEQPLIILDVGAKSTDLIIIDGPKFWIRNLPIAGNSFNQVLQKKFNITPAEAERVKLHMDESRHRAQIFDVVRPVIHDLIGEIQRSIGYYKTLSRDVKFEDIAVVGQGYRLFGLHRMMSEELQYNVRMIEKPEEIRDMSGRGEEFVRMMPSLGAAMGSALFGMKEGEVTINLLPDQFVERREFSRKHVPALAVGILLWLAVGLTHVHNASGLAQIRKLGSKGESTIREFERWEQAYGEAMGISSVEEIQQYVGLTFWREFWPVSIGGLVQAVPQDIYIDRIDVRAGTSAEGRGRPGEELEEEPQGEWGVEQIREARAVGLEEAASIVFVFSATTDFVRGEATLLTTLPESLKRATVYPEKVPLFKRVTLVSDIGVVNRVVEDMEFLDRTGETSQPTADAGRRWPSEPRATRPASGQVASELRIQVECEVRLPQELRELRKDENKEKRELAWKTILESKVRPE